MGIGALKLCLAAGADITITNSYRRSALTLAAMKGHVETTVLLLQANAPTDVIDTSGLSAVGWARKRQHPHIARLILHHIASRTPSVGVRRTLPCCCAMICEAAEETEEV